MRITGYIEHPPYHVTVFEMNHRYSVKIELEGLEQWYKIRPSEKVTGLNDIKVLLNEKFWDGVKSVFHEMKKNEATILEEIFLEEEDDIDIL